MTPMIRKLGQRSAAIFQATAPDPFVLAVLLTGVVLVLAMAVEQASPLAVMRAWQGDEGLWSLLAFSMQMVLILVTGHALAAARPIGAVLRRLAALPRTGGQAAALVAAVSIATSWLNWGLGLVVGALLAREVGGQERVRSHYPLLAAAGFSGMMCWHGGLSGTAPLKMTTPADVERFLGRELASEVGPVPFTETVLGLENLVVSGGLLIAIPLLCFFLAPAAEDPVESRAAFVGMQAPTVEPPPTSGPIPAWLERSPLTMLALAIPLGAAIAVWFVDVGIAGLDPNAVNLMFLTAGLVAHGSLSSYGRAVAEAVRGTHGIVLQFPLYAGIMGVMRGTGLAADLSHWIAGQASGPLFGVLTFLSAGLVNLFVPSGGGQWAIQGPIAVAAARDLGLPLETAIMSVAYGDQWTNMLQPFWALPALAITGVQARDILGYTVLFLAVGGLWMMGCLAVLFAG